MRAVKYRTYFWLLLCLCACADNSTVPFASTDMVHIPGGEFVMGTDDPQSYEPERPAHRVKVAGPHQEGLGGRSASLPHYIPVSPRDAHRVTDQ